MHTYLHTASCGWSASAKLAGGKLGINRPCSTPRRGQAHLYYFLSPSRVWQLFILNSVANVQSYSWTVKGGGKGVMPSLGLAKAFG